MRPALVEWPLPAVLLPLAVSPGLVACPEPARTVAPSEVERRRPDRVLAAPKARHVVAQLCPDVPRQARPVRPRQHGVRSPEQPWAPPLPAGADPARMADGLAWPARTASRPVQRRARTELPVTGRVARTVNYVMG
ncbi:hypothetical protein QLQ12_33885 [Actinoplanes sp. NEAU-A12]|uniref:Secreted protein n=1 Tax=Actinoplanes sandaracinus TaxID=3045177 RepID=A0ABT6WV50_9ACTN|nr:hypothetical protein [Actinoplanes sandaracinus]MDI6103615.1 hypothetical protein [Actinoplanes sandaracinus]